MQNPTTDERRIAFFEYDAGECWDCGKPRDVHDNWSHDYTLRMVPDLTCFCGHLRSDHYCADQIDEPVTPYCDSEIVSTQADGFLPCPCRAYVAVELPGAQQVFHAALDALGVTDPMEHVFSSGHDDLPF